MKKTALCMISFITGLLLTCTASAAVISIDFNNTTVANWVVTGSAGPLSSPNWNNTSTPTGGPLSLVDDSGAPTTATLSWVSANTWTNGDGNSTEDTKLAHAYLDDGGNAGTTISLTLANIPYTDYRVYGLVASGQNGAAGTYTTMDFQVNGSTWVLGDEISGNGSTANNTATVFGGVAANAGGWAEILGDGTGTQTQTGNYWTWEGSGSSLVVNAQNRVGNSRGSITGLIIEDISAIPEPSVLSLALIGFAALFLGRRVRRRG